MSQRPTIDDGRQSLTAHVASKGAEIREKFGPRIGWDELELILQDRAFTRYPCEVVFDASPLQPGEFAFPVARGDDPEAGFTMSVHPHFSSDPDRAVYLVLYQLVAVNYGDFASAEDAETFAAAVLGLPREHYYRAVCGMADEIAAA